MILNLLLSPAMSLTKLSIDIAVLIFPYLNARDFLSFTSCTKQLLSFRQDPTFWRTLTTRTFPFRLPSQLLLRSDGARWQWLCKSLLTQAHVYTWGSNGPGGNLGHSFSITVPTHPPTPGGLRQSISPSFDRISRKAWPTEMKYLSNIGVVIDVQCG